MTFNSNVKYQKKGKKRFLGDLKLIAQILNIMN